MISLRVSFVVLLCLSAALNAADGIPNQTYPVGVELGRLSGESKRTMNLAFVNGYLIQTRHQDDPQANTKVWDISDPEAPVLVRNYNSGSGFHITGYFENYFLPGQGGSGWDYSNAPDLTWRTAFNAPGPGRSTMVYPYRMQHAPAYNYSAGTQKELWSIATGRKVADINVLGDSGLEGRPTIIGNLMLIVPDNATPHGVAAYDLSDPSNPRFLDAIRTTPSGARLNKAYQSVPIWGHYIFLMMSGASGSFKGYDVIDSSDPENLRWVRRVNLSSQQPRYVQFQDEYMFVDDMKIDVRTDEIVTRFPGAGGEYQLPIGHLLATVGMKRTDTGRLWAHQATLDQRGPMITYHLPADGALNQARTSNIGIVIPETLDMRTVINKTTVIVRPVGGQAIDGSIYVSDHDVVSFAPADQLAANTTYEVVLPADGIKDVAGNGIEETYMFRFSTGAVLDGGNEAPVVSVLQANPNPVIAGATATLSAQVSDAENDTLSFRWEFGDGSPDALTGDNASVTHTYAAPGRYTLRLRVSDDSDTTIATRTVVVGRSGGFAGHHSNSILYDASADRIWSVNPDNNTVTSIDAATNTRVFEVSVPNDPRSIAQAPNGTMWVTCHDADAVVILDRNNGAELNRITLDYGDAPHGIVFAPDNSAAYVSCQGSGMLRRFHPSTGVETGAIAVGSSPRALAVSADSARVFVNRFVSAQQQGEVRVVATASWTVEQVIALRIDTTSADSNISARGIPNYLMGLAIRPDGERLWVGGKKDNVVAGQFRDGTTLRFETSQRALIARIDLVNSTESQSDRLDIDNQELPSAIAFTPDSSLAFVAFQGNNEVVAFDVSNGQIVTRIAVGRAPQGLVYDATRGRVYVQNFLSRSVSIIDVADMVTGDTNEMTVESEITSVQAELLSATVLQGKRLFYQASDTRISMDGYISCASCHMDGGEDGRIWDFTQRGEGLRNTITLRGRRGTGHGNVHWTANFDEIHDFEHDIRNAFNGTGLMSESEFQTGTRNETLGDPKAGVSSDLDALAAYVTSLDSYPRSPHRQADGSMTALDKPVQRYFRR